jgi:hypothetical protein
MTDHIEKAREAARAALDNVLPDQALECVSLDHLSGVVADAVLSALSQTHVVVPREATEAMIEAAMQTHYDRDDMIASEGGFEAAWSAMLAQAEKE